jgi:hypothetical protein
MAAGEKVQWDLPILYVPLLWKIVSPPLCVFTETRAFVMFDVKGLWFALVTTISDLTLRSLVVVEQNMENYY